MVAVTYFEGLVILAFLILLAAGIFLVVTVYVCDGQQCKAFKEATKKGETGTVDYTTGLLAEIGNDGVWPLPYIGSVIVAALCMWFLRIKVTVMNYAVLFLVTFVTNYFLFSFYNHHYLKPIVNYSISFINNNCDAIVTQNDIENVGNVDVVEENVENVDVVEENGENNE